MVHSTLNFLHVSMYKFYDNHTTAFIIYTFL